VIWLWERLGDYDKITGPEGLPPDEHDKRLAKHQQTFRRKLTIDYLSHHRRFPMEKVLPPDPSKAKKLTAEKVKCYLPSTFKEINT